ncbi:DUF5802 family protein [Halorussus pelagicus]|uniref:DUF5802 family protein n=1 Tax=Halorussus pelagicus TaxID=2505977 RepID=UPI000FFC04D6|nr:DUF5802 family protein [Halorussus pelagicus]
MFTEFSSGYYLGRLYVEPFEGDRAAIRRDQHEQINEQLYATGEGVERLDSPLVMKVGNRHVAVSGDDGVPEGTLALPEEFLDDADIKNPPKLTEVLLAKAECADQLLRYQSELPSAGT